MYPHAELARLETHKAALRLRIAIRRLEIALAAGEAQRPVAWLDKVVSVWRQFGPLAKFAAIPAALLLRRTMRRPTGLLGTLLRWAPAFFGAGKFLATMRRSGQAG
jgi:hypothetical protein